MKNFIVRQRWRQFPVVGMEFVMNQMEYVLVTTLGKLLIVLSQFFLVQTNAALMASAKLQVDDVIVIAHGVALIAPYPMSFVPTIAAH